MTTEYLEGPIDLLPAPFDGYEVALCAEITSPSGTSYVERMDSPEQLLVELEEGTAILLMFTVYGHFPAGGIHAFADSIVSDENAYEVARAYAQRLAHTIDGGRTQYGVLDLTFDSPYVA